MTTRFQAFGLIMGTIGLTIPATGIVIATLLMNLRHPRLTGIFSSVALITFFGQSAHVN